MNYWSFTLLMFFFWSAVCYSSEGFTSCWKSFGAHSGRDHHYAAKKLPMCI